MQLSEIQGEIRGIEDQINYLRIGKAKLDGERETIEMDMGEYKGVELLSFSLPQVEEKLRKAQDALVTIGSINMRALEVYDHVKKEYDIVKEKVDTLQKEKDEITELLENLKEETGITFSEVKTARFRWNDEKESEIESFSLEGKGFEVQRILADDYKKVESFFREKGFDIDLYNIAAGTVSGATGYKKDQIVCKVFEGATGHKEAVGQWIPPEPNKRDIEVACAILKSQQPEEVVDKEKNCRESGGETITSLCCKSVTDFPNLCLVGACGCSPEESREIKICDCGEGMCFDGNECMTNEEFMKREELCTSPNGKNMSLIEAKEIAIISECGDRLKEPYFEFSTCNSNSGTWWIELDLEKEGCSPACAIDINTKEAKIDWRCD